MAIETTSNIPAGYYITAECTRDVEKFAQRKNYMENLVTKMVLSMQMKLSLRFSCMILNIFNRYLSYTFFFRMIDHLNVNFFHDPIIFVIHTNLCLDCTFFASYSIE